MGWTYGQTRIDIYVEKAEGASRKVSCFLLCVCHLGRPPGFPSRLLRSGSCIYGDESEGEKTRGAWLEI